MARRDAVQAFALDGGAALYQERAGRLHLLNPTAHALWRGLERGEALPDIARDVAGRWRMPLPRVLSDLAGARERFRQAGLIGAVASQPFSRRPADLPPATVHLPPGAEERGYRIAGVGIAVATTARGWAHVDAVLGHLRGAADAPALAVELCPRGAGFVLNVGGREWLRTADAGRLHGALLRALAHAACAAPRWLAVLHAGAVARGGRCLVFPAPGGRGKTTLVAALMHAGCAMLGDDIVALDRATLRIAALPLPLRVKRGSWRQVARWYPRLHASPPQREGARRLRLLRPAVPADRAWARDHEAQALVTPAWRPGAPARLERCSHLDMLDVLLSANARIASPCDAGRVRRLVRWVRARPAYRLEFDDAAAAARLLERLLPA